MALSSPLAGEGGPASREVRGPDEGRFSQYRRAQNSLNRPLSDAAPIGVPPPSPPRGARGEGQEGLLSANTGIRRLAFNAWRRMGLGWNL